MKIDWRYLVFNVATTGIIAGIMLVVWKTAGFRVMLWLYLAGIAADQICNRTYKP